MIAELVQWANEEFAGEGWTFRDDDDQQSPIRFVHGSSRDRLTRIVIMVTSWAVTWRVFDESVGCECVASGRRARRLPRRESVGGDPWIG